MSDRRPVNDERENTESSRRAILLAGTAALLAPAVTRGSKSVPEPAADGAATTVQSLRTTAGEYDGQTLVVSGYRQPGDGGGGMFIWVAASDAMNDGGVVIELTSRKAVGRWHRAYSGAVDVRWFGAIGDRRQDKATINGDAFEAAIAYPSVFVPAGEYVIDRTLTLRTSGMRFSGENQKLTKIIMARGTKAPMLAIAAHSVYVSDLGLGWQDDIPADGAGWENAVAILFQREAEGSRRAIGWGQFERLSIRNCYTGIAVDRSQEIAGAFSWAFRDLYIRQVRGHGIALINKATGNSGCVFSNIYIANSRKGSETSLELFVLGQGRNTVIQQLNLEATRLRSRALCKFDSVKGLVVQGIHIESVAWLDSGKNKRLHEGRSAVVFSRSTVASVQGVALRDCHVPSSISEWAIVRLETDAKSEPPRVRIAGLDMTNPQSVASQTRFIADFSSLSNAALNEAKLAVTEARITVPGMERQAHRKGLEAKAARVLTIDGA